MVRLVLAPGWALLDLPLLLARIQIESGLVQSRTSNNLSKATGCGCPDSGGCNTSYVGFGNQVECGAAKIRNYLRDLDAGRPTVSGWKVGVTRQTLDPCTVTPATKATAALYTYTPWVGAYASQCGKTSVGGSSLVSAVFTRYRGEYNWGSGCVLGGRVAGHVPGRGARDTGRGGPLQPLRVGQHLLDPGDRSPRGAPSHPGAVGGARLGDGTGLPDHGRDEHAGHRGPLQPLPDGQHLLDPGDGGHEVRGLIRDKWASLGWEKSALGYPVSNEYAVTGGSESEFQKGYLTWSSASNSVSMRIK